MSGRVYCECQDYWKGEACNIPYCRNNCGSPDRGYCDLTGEKLCVCNDSWQGDKGRSRNQREGAAYRRVQWDPLGSLWLLEVLKEELYKAKVNENFTRRSKSVVRFAAINSDLLKLIPLNVTMLDKLAMQGQNPKSIY